MCNCQSIQLYVPDLDGIAVSMGKIRESTVCIQDETVITFLKDHERPDLSGSLINDVNLVNIIPRKCET